jgi:hypothetical protein
MKRLSPLKFWALLGALQSLGCAETESRTFRWDDTNPNRNLSVFIVSAQSNISGDFEQSISPPAEDPSTGSLIYYFTQAPQLLKDCGLAQNQVQFRQGYHSAETINDQVCVDLANQLRAERLFPVNEDFEQTASNIELSKNGYVYVYFFYGYNESNPGTGVAVGQAVGAGNRCFRLWSAEVLSGQLVNKSLSPVETVDLNTLRCFGF